jgi:predicted small metal-binding protein
MAMSTCGDLAQVCGFHEWQADYAAMQGFLCIQLGRNKSWNAKGEQFPKNIWVLNGFNMAYTSASLSGFSTKPISRAL